MSHKIYNFINSLPDEYLIRDGYGKSILRDSLKGLVPKEILKFREKIGFYADLDSFFDRKNSKFKDMLFQSKLINSFLEIKNINDLLEKDKLNNAESKFIFCILNLAILSSK